MSSLATNFEDTTFSTMLRNGYDSGNILSYSLVLIQEFSVGIMQKRIIMLLWSVISFFRKDKDTRARQG